jgi:hypothetical protein
MYAQLSTAELQTLHILSDQDSADCVPRSHLEKLSRLDLIEPAGCNVAVSTKGRALLSGGRK